MDPKILATCNCGTSHTGRVSYKSRLSGILTPQPQSRIHVLLLAMSASVILTFPSVHPDRNPGQGISNKRGSNKLFALCGLQDWSFLLHYGSPRVTFHFPLPPVSDYVIIGLGRVRRQDRSPTITRSRVRVGRYVPWDRNERSCVPPPIAGR